MRETTSCWVSKWRELSKQAIQAIKNLFRFIQSKARTKIGQRSYLRMWSKKWHFVQFYVMCRIKTNGYKMLLKIYIGSIRSKFWEKIGQLVICIGESMDMSQMISCIVSDGELLQGHLFHAITCNIKYLQCWGYVTQDSRNKSMSKRGVRVRVFLSCNEAFVSTNAHINLQIKQISNKSSFFLFLWK